MEGAASCGDNSTDKDQIHAKVGHLESPDIVRIVHISDTHEKQDTFIPKIPRGDILIHSGDFTNFKIVGSLEEDMEKINDFFRKLPHKHKIFVAGNHDIQLAWRSHCPKKIADLLHNGIYLQDSSVTLEGIKIYGSPWNTSDGMGFYEADLKPVWHKVPNNTDILVTHNPPFGIKDFGYNKFWCDGDREWICDFCTEKNASGDTVYHGSYAHQGCMNLRKAIFKHIRQVSQCHLRQEWLSFS